MSPVDYRKDLTEKIIRQLEAGTAPWVRPWDTELAPPGFPFNAVSERRYHGGNLLWLACQGYADPRWATYRQAQEQGWQVRKGEKSTAVEYWQWTEKKLDEQGRLVEVKLEQPKVFYAIVFNAAQMDNVPAFASPPLAWKPEEMAEKILLASGVDIRYDKTDTAFYSPRSDQIHMPPRIMFSDAERFYATALHELGHWTGHVSRLNRDLMHAFGGPGYAKEELRAELASYFLSARLGIPHDSSQHAAYIGSWIDVLRKDHNEIFRAAKDAEKICEFVLEYQHEKTKDQIAETSIEVGDESALSPEKRRGKKRVPVPEMEC